MNAINFVKGLLIGIALVIPGLSGSMFAVVVGLYDGLLHAANHFSKDIKKHALFLLPVLLGGAVGILSSAKFILWVCERYTFQSYAFFMGLVLGSAPLACKKMTANGFCRSKLLISLISFAAILVISFAAVSFREDAASHVAIESLTGLQDIGMVAFAGIFSCSLMVIPGVSGSVMLILINQYGTVYHAVSVIGDIIRHMLRGNWQGVVGLFPAVAVILPFVTGAAAGLVLIAKLLSWLLDRFESEVYYGVIGLIAGAAVILFKDGVYAGLLNHINGGASGFSGLCIIGIFVIIGGLCTQALDS